MQQEEKDIINENSRRSFKTAAVAAVATAACGSLTCSCSSKKARCEWKVKLLSPDGEIVEIDSSYLNHQNIWPLCPNWKPEKALPEKIRDGGGSCPL